MKPNTCPTCGAELPAQPASFGKAHQVLLWVATILSAVATIGIGVLLFVQFQTPSQPAAPSSAVDPYNTLNIVFQCVDAATNADLDDCQVHVSIVDESRVTEFDPAPGSTQLIIPIKRRLAVTADQAGYSRTSLIFEYIDDGSQQVQKILMEATP